MGLLDQLSSGLLGGTDPTAQLGLSLLAANQPSPVRQPFGGILARGVMGAQQQQQLLQQMQLERLKVAMEQQRLGMFSNLMGDQGTPAAALAGGPAGPVSSAAPPGVQGGGGGGGAGGDGTPPMLAAPQQPQQSPAPPQQPSGPSPYDPVTQDTYAAAQVPGSLFKSAKQAGAYAALSNQDPQKASDAFTAQQRDVVKQQRAATVAKLDAIIHSPYTAAYVQSDPDLLARFQQLAPQLGFKELNTQTARNVLGLVRNPLAASVGIAEAETPQEEKTNYIGLGGSNQTDYLGKITPGAAQQKVGDYLIPQPNGQPPKIVQRTEAEGMREGLTPNNAQSYAAAMITDQAKELAYQRFKVTGEMPTTGARSAVAQSQYANYFASRAAQDGDTGAAQAARSQQYKASQGVVKGFESGAESKTINGINTAVQHMAALQPLADALDNGNLTLINKVANGTKSVFGSPAPTNFAALKEFVAGEVAKAVLPGGGGEGERQALGAPLNAANSPAQLSQAIVQIKTALAGKTEALRNQWDVGTNGQQGSFDKFLLPATKDALGISAGAPASGGAIPAGWTVTQK